MLEEKINALIAAGRAVVATDFAEDAYWEWKRHVVELLTALCAADGPSCADKKETGDLDGPCRERLRTRSGLRSVVTTDGEHVRSFRNTSSPPDRHMPDT